MSMCVFSAFHRSTLPCQHRVQPVLQALTAIPFDDVVMGQIGLRVCGVTWALKMTYLKTVCMHSLQLILSTVNKYGNDVYETQTSFRRKKNG